MDFPDDYRETYRNKWGTFKWSGTDMSTRPHYYGYGLLTRYFRGPAAVVAVESNDPRVRAAGLRHRDSDTWSIALVNRNPTGVQVALSLPDTGPLRRYDYDPAAPPFSPFGDLPPPSAVVEPAGGRLEATLPADSLVVLTSRFDHGRPAAVKGVKARRTAEGVAVTWQSAADARRSARPWPPPSSTAKRLPTHPTR
jgi:hypothetical protein